MPLLETIDVNVNFGGHHALIDVCIDADPGLVTGLIGPNGAGKTTLFNVITGLQDATRGKVLLDEEDITGCKTHERARKGVARTFQRLEVFGSLSVLDNVLVAAEIRKSFSGNGGDPRARAHEIVDRIGLRAVADDRVDALPTGLARLVELGRALATEPKLLLLDEPASGLDDAESESFAQLLRELAEEGMAVLLVEHDVQLVMEVCSVVHVLNFGKIIARGSPDEIRSNEEVVDAYLGAGHEEPE